MTIDCILHKETQVIAAIWTRGTIVAEFLSIDHAIDSGLRAIRQLDGRICFYTRQEWENRGDTL